MAQRNRHDRPGQRHHIYNRGLAKRVMFPDHRAKRRFLALLLCAVRRGEIQVESYSVMDTHFHLLAKSTDVSISYPLMRVQNAYTRYHNRRFRRDGPLGRGRFGSSPVGSQLYAFTALRYIDFNPVKAKICANPTDYPYGSAHVYGSLDAGPAWLSRDLVDTFLTNTPTTPGNKAAAYRRMFGVPLSADETEVVERRLHSPARARDDLDRLHALPPARVAAWMRRKARLADGLSPWAPIVGSGAVQAVLAGARQRRGNVHVQVTRKRWCAWTLLTAGLLHDAAGMGCEEVARALRCASSTAGRRLRIHRETVRENAEYARLAGELLAEAIRLTYPRGAPA